MSETEPSLIPTRYSLLSRLQNWDDQASWKVFFDTYWRLIYSFALKSGLTETEAQDVVQETIIAVAKDIHKFKRDRTLGTFKGWLRNLTRWRIADQLRRRTRHPSETDLSGAPGHAVELAEIPDPAGGALDDIWDVEWQSNLFDSAVERIKQKIQEEHFQIFDLHVIRQWPASRVAETLGIGVSRVYLVKFRVVGLIKKEIRRMEKEN
ncbi:MAG TPA: sigma-70 family RNA polymerase sigma factor [Candidatus Sulfotelmatobacter sp.]|nr:sigma-70 family RNA polymerase sigma factor [Candidatus Sulfotelmatobacter sp.]